MSRPHINEVKREFSESHQRSVKRRLKDADRRSARLDVVGIFGIALMIVLVLALVAYLQGGAFW